MGVSGCRWLRGACPGLVHRRVARERDGLTWTEYSVRLQRYFSELEFIFSPELFIVGGGISQRTDEYLPLLSLRTPIVPAMLKNEAGIFGAAMQAASTHHQLATLA